MKKLKPLGDNVVLKPILEEEITKSGIVLPDTAEKEKTEQAMVVAVGPGKEFENGRIADMPVKEGHTVLYKKYGPDEIKIGDEEYLVCSIDDVLAIIE